MIKDKKVKVSTGGKQVSEAIIPLYPEKVDDVVAVFKSTPEIALKALQNGLTIDYQRIERNKFVVRVSKPSKAKTELLAGLKERGYYREEYENWNIVAITQDAWKRVPSKK